MQGLHEFLGYILTIRSCTRGGCCILFEILGILLGTLDIVLFVPNGDLFPYFKILSPTHHHVISENLLGEGIKFE
jgi:hypothetical protein